jgi:hypothetical protein
MAPEARRCRHRDSTDLALIRAGERVCVRRQAAKVTTPILVIIFVTYVAREAALRPRVSIQSHGDMQNFPHSIGFRGNALSPSRLELFLNKKEPSSTVQHRHQ